MIIDEAHLLFTNNYTQKNARFSRSLLFTIEGWQIVEKFDEQYDTEVGIVSTIMNQKVTQEGRIESTIIGKTPFHSVIIDYKNNKVITKEEAADRPELIKVFTRLQERVVEYKSYLLKCNAE